MKFLKLIGAVSAAEHGELETRFKTAIKDLAAEVKAHVAATSERDSLKNKLGEENRTGTRLALDLSTARKTIAAQAEEIAALRPDAEKWRDRAARELQRGQAKRDAAAKAFAEATTGKGRPYATPH